MTCRDYQHQISLFLYDELPEDDKPGLEAHLVACEACKHLFDEEKGLHYVLAEDTAGWDFPSDLLVESRSKLANELDQIEQKRAWWRIPTFSVVFTPMRLLESAALVAMGLALGVYVSNQQHAVRQAAAVNPAQQESQMISSIPANGSVSNLHVVSANPSTGQVELAGEIVQPLRMQGTLSDDTVRQLLLNALGDASNSGSRLRAVEVLAPRANDQTVKSALIQALRTDDNPGVRLHALQGLKQFASETDVRAAFMGSVENDLDAGIRVEAIDALTRSGNDVALARALQRFTKDDNTYVRMKALQFVGTHP
jgi:hypothetical protein